MKGINAQKYAEKQALLQSADRSMLDNMTKEELIERATILGMAGEAVLVNLKTDEEIEIERIEDFLEKEHKKDSRLTITLIENAIQYTEGCGIGNEYHNDIPVKDLIVGIVKPYVENLAIRHLVGIQPMTGPVGLIYKLNYSDAQPSDDPEINDRKVVLEVQSTAVEAGSRKFDLDVRIGDGFDFIDTKTHERVNLPKAITSDIYEEVKTELIKIAHTDTVDVTDNHNAAQIMAILGKYTNEIARKSRRGAANWAIVSETVAEIIEPKLKIDAALSPRQYGYLNYVGSFGGVAIYLDEKIKHDKILLGYKGNGGETDAGYWYCPYIPVMTGGLVRNPHSFEPTMGFMTRYGKTTNQRSETIEYEVEDGTKQETLFDKCNYYYSVTLEGLPNTDLKKLKMVPITEPIATDEQVDHILDVMFESAMEILD